MKVELGKIIKANKRAIRVLELCIHRMQDLMDEALPDDVKLLRADIDSAVRKRDLLSNINIHLAAARVRVVDMDPGEVKTLENLEDRLNQAIVNNAIASATLDFISGLVNVAVKIGGIATSNS